MFDIVFAQLGVIPRIRNKFAKIVAVAERCFITDQFKNKESRSSNSCKISWWKNIIEKGKNFFGPNLEFCQFG